jgi:hypothetical protein
MTKAGVPVTPGYHGEDQARVLRAFYMRYQPYRTLWLRAGN